MVDQVLGQLMDILQEQALLVKVIMEDLVQTLHLVMAVVVGVVLEALDLLVQLLLVALAAQEQHPQLQVPQLIIQVEEAEVL
jgi:hypothetical protein